MDYSLPRSQPFLVQEDMGTNAPVIHQRIIAQLTTGLYPQFRSGAIPYEPLPEMMLGEYSSPTPDVILYDNAIDQTRVIIEVCHTRGVKDDIQKVIRLIDGELYGIQEGFVYDYKTRHWFRYRLGDGGLTTESSLSEILQLDLNQFLEF
jgi:Uma2 family endonuclease